MITSINYILSLHSSSFTRKDFDKYLNPESLVTEIKSCKPFDKYLLGSKASFEKNDVILCDNVFTTFGWCDYIMEILKYLQSKGCVLKTLDGKKLESSQDYASNIQLLELYQEIRHEECEIFSKTYEGIYQLGNPTSSAGKLAAGVVGAWAFKVTGSTIESTIATK